MVNKMLIAAIKNMRLYFGRALRETGQALDRSGSRLTEDVAYLQRVSRHRKLLNLQFYIPQHGESFISPSSCLAGSVQVGHGSSIWYGASLRGDIAPIRVGNNVSIGENTILRTANNLPKFLPPSVTIADNVVVEDSCTLISCTIDENVFIGRGSIISGGVSIEKGAVIKAGSVVPPGLRIPAYTVWGGIQFQLLRDATPEDLKETNLEVQRNQEKGLEHMEILKSMGKY